MPIKQIYVKKDVCSRETVFLLKHKKLTYVISSIATPGSRKSPCTIGHGRN